MDGGWGIIRKYLLFGGGFAVFTGAAALEAWLSLIDRMTGRTDGVTFDFLSRDLFSMVFPIFGLVLILFGIWWTRPKRPAVADAEPSVAVTDSAVPTAESEPLADSRSFGVKIGDLEDLVSDRPPMLSYSLQPREREDLRYLWHWREAQEANPAQYVRINLVDVDCAFLGLATPYVRLMFSVNNFHAVSLKVTGIEQARLDVTGPSFPGRRSANLPPPRIDGTWDVNRGEGKTFDIDVHIFGTNLDFIEMKELIVASKEKREELFWTLKGNWKATIYGTEREIMSSEINYSGLATNALRN